MSDELDYDLRACLEFNPVDEFDIKDIDKVVAVWEGANDGDMWRWIVHMKDGCFVFLIGGCGYTGWDCQSWLGYFIADSAIDAAQLALAEIVVNPADLSLAQKCKLVLGELFQNGQEVYDSLCSQIEHGKNTTWRETMDDEFGINDE